MDQHVNSAFWWIMFPEFDSDSVAVGFKCGWCEAKRKNEKGGAVISFDGRTVLGILAGNANITRVPTISSIRSAVSGRSLTPGTRHANATSRGEECHAANPELRGRARLPEKASKPCQTLPNPAKPCQNMPTNMSPAAVPGRWTQKRAQKCPNRPKKYHEGK